MNSESKVVVNKIVRYSLDLEFSDEHPPEELIRYAIRSLLISLASAIENSDVKSNTFFPLIFPLDLSMHSEQLRWNFRLVAKLENYLESGQ